MSLFKRQDTWWCDFTMHGDRYRESLKTTDKREAIAKEKERIAEVQAGKNLAVHRHFARWPFSQAADFYIEDLKLRLAQHGGWRATAHFEEGQALACDRH